MSKKIRIFLLSCALMVMCCMGITAGASDNAKVIAHNLTITDEGISVNFYVDIDVEAQNDIKVTLNGSQVEIPAEPTEIIIDAKAYSCYKFTQPVVAKEMDDKVSLSIVAGEKELVTDSYSVNDYVAEVQAGGYGYNFENLANAMTYYGEFAEVYLKYNNATSVSEKALASIDGFNEDVLDAYAMTKGSEYPEGLTYYGTQLNLNSEITLRLCFQLAEGKTAADYGNITAVSIDGTKDLGVLKKGSYKDTQYYYVDIANIGADALGKSYEIKADGKTLLSNCSVLSYASAVVKKYGNDAAKADLANLSKALYLYSEKANLYVESKLVAVYDIFYGSEGFSATPDEFTPVYLTSNGDVTTESTGNTQVTTLSLLNDSRTKGCSVWMKEAYTPTEEVLAGPYVIRRYAGNTGNVLSVTGTATVNTKIDGSCGNFVAQYPNATASVTFESTGTVTAETSLVQVGTGAEFTIGQGGIIQNSHVQNGEVYVSGTLKVAGNAKSGVVNVSATTLEIVADGLTADGEVVFPKHNTQVLTGTGAVSAIKLVDDGYGHFGAYETAEGLNLGSIICGCGDNISQDPTHSCGWTDAQGGVQAAYAIEWTATESLPTSAGSYYLTASPEETTTTWVDMDNITINLDLAGHTIKDTGNATAGDLYGMLYRVKSGTLNIADSSKDETGKICMMEGRPYGGIGAWGSSTKAETHINIYGGTLEAEYGTPVVLRKGYISMEGGTILPGEKVEGFTRANALQVGIGNNGLTNLNVSGGTIKGEVIIQDTKNVTFAINGDAKVGIKDDTQPEKPYGIKTTEDAAELWTINCEGITDKATIVLDNLVDVSITGKGDASAIEYKEDGAGHFGAYETEEGLKIGSVICGCGANVSQDPNHSCTWTTAQGGVEAAYALEWTATESLPTSAGSYYLTTSPEQTTTTWVDMDNITINLDLAGHTIKDTGNAATGDLNGMLYRIKSGTLNIADSSKDETGKICMVGERTYGGIGAWGSSTKAETHVNIYGGTLEAEYGTPIVLRKGYANMEGGTILPGTKVEGFTRANAIQAGIGNNSLTNLNVSGGTIKGEVIIQDTKNVTFAITGNAQVGIKDDNQPEKPYGIKTAEAAAKLWTINCEGITDKATVVLENLADISITGNGDASAIKFKDDGHGHFGAYETEAGLMVGSIICGCGDNISQDPNHSCGWTTAQGGVEAAYALEWTATTSLPTSAGSYYLTASPEETTTTWVDMDNITINLDLAGHTIKDTGNAATGDLHGMLYRIKSGTLNIADSSKDETGKICMVGERTYGGIGAWGTSTKAETHVNIYGGTLEAEYGTPIVLRKGYANMEGGTILPGTKVEGFTRANAVQVGIGNNSLTNLNVSGGTIKGEVIILDTENVTLTITGDAQVGIKESEQSEKPYGIGTADTVTSAQAINFSNTSGNVVLKDTTYLALAEGATGDASKFAIIDKRNQVVNVDESETLGYAAYMCVCGKTDGRYDHTDGCEQPAYAWEPWTSTTGLPTENGSFYLTQNLTGLTTRSTIGSGYIVNLDLAGYTVDGPGTGGVLYRIQRGGLNLSDSSKEKTGTIKATGESTGVGRALYIWGNEGNAANSWYANIFGGTLTAETGAPVAISRGNINMYAGNIKAGTSVEFKLSDAVKFMTANSVQVGLYTGQTANLNVKGGIITGEVLIANETSSTVTVSDNAKVGIADGTKAYAIDTVSVVASAQTVVCNDVTADASVVIKNLDKVGVTGTGEASAFTVLEPSRNTIIDDNADGIGTLGYEAYMCVCGEKDGNYDHHGEDCGKPESAWLPWTSTTSLPTEAGSYYLTTDIAVSAMTKYEGIQVNLDLAGHTVKGQTQDTEGVSTALVKIMKTGRFNITDTVGDGMIKNACQVEQVLYGTVIQMINGDENVDACVNLFAGTLTSAGATCIEGIEEYTVRLGAGTFNMYGGAIEDNLGEADNFKAVSSDDYKWEGGTVFEDGVYVKGGVANTFRAGFGKTNINPENGVSLGSFGDEGDRTSRGILVDSNGTVSDLEAVAIAVTDAENNTLILVVTDLSWGRISDANAIREEVYERYGIPKENVLVGGTHNHSAPSAKWTTNSLNVKYMKQWKENVLTAIGTALRDRAEATLEVGSTETENMVFSRRYLLKDNSYVGGGGEFTTEDYENVVEHETKADEEIQMLKFDRGDKTPILITQWQSHACNVNGGSSDGDDHYMASGEWPQVIRRTLETELGVHCMYMQGAAGNLGSMSRIKGENLYNAESDPENETIGYSDYVAIGEKVASYVSTAYKAEDVFTEVESGLIQIDQHKMPVELRKKTDEEGNVTQEQGMAEEADYPELNTVAIGDVSLVTLPSELFDTSAVEVKTATPFEMTLIMGYTCGNVGYEAPSKFWAHGGYEVTNGYYVQGTADLMVQHYIDKLNAFFEAK